MATKLKNEEGVRGGTVYAIGIEKLPNGKFRSVSFRIPADAALSMVDVVEESPPDDVLITKAKCKYAFAKNMLLKNPWE